MFSHIDIKAKLQAVLRLFVMCAVLLNVAVPAGAMVEKSPDGTVKIVVCSAQGMLNAWLNVETGQLVEQNGDYTPDDADMPSDCPMAAPMVMADSDANAVVKFPVRVAQPYRPELVELAPVIGQSPARLSARDPPISV